MRQQPYEQPSHEHAIRRMLLRSARSQGGLSLPGALVIVRRRMPHVVPAFRMAPAFVGSPAVNSGSSNTWSITHTFSAGHFAFLGVRGNDEQLDTGGTPVSSSPSNTWIVDKSFQRAAGNPQFLTAYALNVAGGSTTIQGTFPAGGTDWDVIVAEFSGIALASAFDVGADQTDSVTGDTIRESGDTAATSQADALAIGAFSTLFAGDSTYTAGSGYTLAQSNSEIALEYKILSATGVQNATIDTGNSNSSQDCRVAVFKAAGAAAPSLFPPFNRPRMTYVRM